MPCAPAPLRAPPGLAACGALRADASALAAAPLTRAASPPPPRRSSSPRARPLGLASETPARLASPRAPHLRRKRSETGTSGRAAGKPWLSFLFFPVGTQFRLFFFFILRGKRARGEAPGQRPSNAPCAMGAGEADASPPAMVRRRQTRLSGETPRGAALGGGACGGRARTCERQRPCSRAAPRLLARHPPARAQGTQAAVSRLPPTRVAPSDGWTPPSSLVLLPSPLPLSVPPAPNLAVARPLVHASPCAALPAPARAHPLHTHTHLTRRNPPPRPRTNSGWSGRTAWPRPCLAAWPT